MKCEYRKCNNEFEPVIWGGNQKRFCSIKCRENEHSLRWGRLNPEKKAKWRRDNPRKQRISMIKSYLRNLTEEELKEVLEGYSND